MISRRTLLKFAGLLPFIGPAVAKAVAKSSSISRRVYPPFLPPLFPKWDKAVDGLEPASKWAIEFEAALLRADLTYPRAGQVWETVCDCEVPFRASVPFQRDLASFLKWGFGMAELNRGERVRIIAAEGPKPVQVTFVPLRYEELQRTIVPAPTRELPGYSGYVLHLKTAQTVADLTQKTSQVYFTKAFRLLDHVT